MSEDAGPILPHAAPSPAPQRVRTPCRKVCVVDPLSSLCIGCGRTLKEIGAWSGYSDATRAEVMALLPDRLARLRAVNPGAFQD